MRFLLTLQVLNKQRFLPVNYQYELSSWIYGRIAAADKDFADYLHQRGFGLGGRRFKLFTFSPLDLRPFRLHKERGVFELRGDHVKLLVSFSLEPAAEGFIRGLFSEQQFGLGDKISRVDFEVAQIETLAAPYFQKTMQYSALSPVCVSRPAREGEHYAQYLYPHDTEFAPRLMDNLVQKWAAQEVFVHEGAVPEVQHPKNDLQLKVLTEKPKSKLVTLKAFTSQQSKVKGYLFDFELTAPMELQELAYAAGVGEKGSMGFGMVEVINRY